MHSACRKEARKARLKEAAGQIKSSGQDQQVCNVTETAVCEYRNYGPCALHSLQLTVSTLNCSRMCAGRCSRRALIACRRIPPPQTFTAARWVHTPQLPVHGFAVGVLSHKPSVLPPAALSCAGLQSTEPPTSPHLSSYVTHTHESFTAGVPSLCGRACFFHAVQNEGARTQENV